MNKGTCKLMNMPIDVRRKEGVRELMSVRKLSLAILGL